MYLVLIAVAAVVLVGLMAFYYRKLMDRAAAAMGKTIPKKSWLIPLAGSVGLGVLSVNIFSAAGIFLLYVLMFALACDLGAKLCRRYLPKEKRKPWMKRLWQTTLVPVVLAAAVMVYGVYNIHDQVETDYTIHTEKPLPGDIRILMIADSHYGKVLKSEELRELKEEFDKTDPDLVVLVGDIVDENTTKEEMEEIFALLGSIPTRYGTYYVAGNHDRQVYTGEPAFTSSELDDTIDRSGIAMIYDGSCDLDCGITIVGREDYGAVDRATLEELMYGVDKSRFILTLDHQPLEYDENERLGTDLILSGHTHAGQIWPLGYFIQLFHTADRWYGYEKRGDMQAIVTSGLVGWGYPIRTQKHSEYVVMTLTND